MEVACGIRVETFVRLLIFFNISNGNSCHCVHMLKNFRFSLRMLFLLVVPAGLLCVRLCKVVKAPYIISVSRMANANESLFAITFPDGETDNYYIDTSTNTLIYGAFVEPPEMRRTAPTRDAGTLSADRRR